AGPALPLTPHLLPVGTPLRRLPHVVRRRPHRLGVHPPRPELRHPRPAHERLGRNRRRGAGRGDHGHPMEAPPRPRTLTVHRRTRPPADGILGPTPAEALRRAEPAHPTEAAHPSEKLRRAAAASPR